MSKEFMYNREGLNAEALKLIGCELKRRRQLQSRTLDSFNLDCSVSYLSKLENGKIIPKYQVLRDLCSEQGIKQEELNLMLKINEILEVSILNLYNHDYLEIQNTYEKIKKYDNYKVNFLKLFYLITKNQYKKFKDTLQSIEIIKDKLSLEDLNLLAFFKMHYLNQINKPLSAYKESLHGREIKDPYLKVLTLKEQFYAICMSGIDNETKAYQNLYNAQIKLLAFDFEKELKLYIKTLIRKKIEIPPHLLQKLKTEEKLAIYLRNEDVLNLEKLYEAYLLKQIPLKPEEEFFILVGLKNYHKALEVYAKIDLISLSALDSLYLNYAYYYALNDEEAMLSYLTNEVIPYAIKTEDLILFEAFLKILSNLSIKTGKYKNVALANINYFKLLDYKNYVCVKN